MQTRIEAYPSSGAPTVPDSSSRPTAAIGGWLLFLCVALTVIGPLLRFVGIQDELGSLKAFADYESFRRFIGADVAFAVLLMGLSAYAGIALWHRQRHAPKAVKTFLGALIAWQVILAIAVFSVTLPPPIEHDFTLFAMAQTIGNFAIAFAAWMYLDRSERVRHLFPDSRNLFSST